MDAHARTKFAVVSGMVHKVATGGWILSQKVAINGQLDWLKRNTTLYFVLDHLNALLAVYYPSHGERQSTFEPPCCVVVVVAVSVDHLVGAIAVDRVRLASATSVLVAVVADELSRNNLGWLKSGGRDSCEENLRFIGGKFLDLAPVMLESQINE